MAARRELASRLRLLWVSTCSPHPNRRNASLPPPPETSNRTQPVLSARFVYSTCLMLLRPKLKDHSHYRHPNYRQQSRITSTSARNACPPSARYPTPSSNKALETTNPRARRLVNARSSFPPNGNSPDRVTTSCANGNRTDLALLRDWSAYGCRRSRT